MQLEGQGRQAGYALAAVLISVAIMSIVMTALLPVWRQQMQREKEAELAFRGEQYARAIYLFNVKNGGQFPPSIDALVQGRYLRKKYKDPMTEDGEFLPLSVGANQPGPQGGAAGGRGAGPGQGSGGRGLGSGQRGGAPSPGLGGSQPPGGARGGGGIRMVVSQSKEASIRVYNGADVAPISRGSPAAGRPRAARALARRGAAAGPDAMRARDAAPALGAVQVRGGVPAPAGALRSRRAEAGSKVTAGHETAAAIVRTTYLQRRPVKGRPTLPTASAGAPAACGSIAC